MNVDAQAVTGNLPLKSSWSLSAGHLEQQQYSCFLLLACTCRSSGSYCGSNVPETTAKYHAITSWHKGAKETGTRPTCFQRASWNARRHACRRARTKLVAWRCTSKFSLSSWQVNLVALGVLKLADVMAGYCVLP